MIQSTLAPWLQAWLQACRDCFGQRLLFAGLQGSCRRGEADADSDVDLVVILEELNVSDLKAYRSLLHTLPPTPTCGFLAGKEELRHWIRSDLFQFYHDTQPLYGDLDALRALFTNDDVEQAIHLGACNLYHAACHSYVFEESATALPLLYKMSFFLLQAETFLRTGTYIPTKHALLDVLTGEDRLILQACINKSRLLSLTPEEREASYQRLLAWTGTLIRTYGQR